MNIKAIKNYTTTVAADKSISEIQIALVRHGATGVLYEYESGNGRITALKFRLPIRETQVNFALPVEWRRFQAVLKKQHVSKAYNDDFCYRVAWRNIRDWVLAQLALYETQIVDLPQIFLPFATSRQGRTFYEEVMTNRLLLEERPAG